MVRLAACPATFKGGDLNSKQRAAAAALGRKVVGSGALWLTLPRVGWTLIGHASLDVGSDHPAEFVTMMHNSSARVCSLLVINAMGVSAGETKSRAIMRKGLRLQPDVVLASECRKIGAHFVDPQGHYNFEQPGRYGSSESGVLLAARRKTMLLDQTESRVASERTPEGGGPGIDRRLIVKGRLTIR